MLIANVRFTRRSEPCVRKKDAGLFFGTQDLLTLALRYGMMKKEDTKEDGAEIMREELMEKLCMSNHVYSSKARVKNNRIDKVISVADKELIARQFVQPMVTIVDGDNDTGLAEKADISIGFGGVRNIAPSLLRCIDYAFYDDKTCVKFLERLL